MMPYGDGAEYEDVPASPASVDEPQVPTAPKWSWDTKNVLIAAAAVIGGGFIIWLVMDYNNAKRLFAAEQSGDGNGNAQSQ